MQTSTANGDGLAINDLAFLYPRKLGPDEPRLGFERSFFMLPPGSDVPPKYPNKAPKRTLWDLIVMYLFEHELSTLALAGRSLCHAVRKRRFRILTLHPHMNHARLVQILHPSAVLPYVRQLTVNGRLRYPGMISPEGQADHRWLNDPQLVQLIADLCTHSPIEYLSLQSLSWGDIRIEVRNALRSMRGVRALMVHDVDFWNSNQYLMTLNAYPGLQFLSVAHANFHALTHVPAQLRRTEPLLLTELVARCAYTGLLMEWLLGRREMLAVEEMTLDCKDLYRDDARLARVLRKVGPWLKRFYYTEYASNEICEGAGYGSLLDPHELEAETPKPWTPPQRISRDGDALEDGEDDEEVMDLDYDDPSDVMDDDSESDVMIDSNGAVSSTNHDHPATDTQSPLVSYVSLSSSTLLLPDDEGGNQFENCSSDLSHPPFSSTEERGYHTFADELARRIDTPMLEAIDARINWTSAFSLLTLKMLCQFTYTYKGFYRFEVRIVFATPELFESAPWKAIDSLLARTSRRLPGGIDRDGDDEDEDEEDEEEAELSLMISVKGWNVDGREGRARMRDLRRNLPRTSAEDVLEIELERWWHYVPRWAPLGMLD